MVAYIAAQILMIIAALAYAKTSGSLWTRPAQGAVSLFYDAFGAISNISVIFLIGWGFYQYDWWLPLAVTFGGAFAIGVLLGRLLHSFGATLVLVAFPLGAAFAAYSIF